MARLPEPGKDSGIWGKVLNEYLLVSHTDSGTLKPIAQSDISNLDTALAAKAPLQSPAFTGTPTGITKAHVGLGNVDNVSDMAKPISTATQTALDTKLTASLASLDARYLGLGAANNPVKDAAATRPTGFPVVYWQSATQPVNWQPGDIWLKV